MVDCTAHYKILRCEAANHRNNWECELAIDGDITTLLSDMYPLGWAFDYFPTNAIFYLEGPVSVNTIIIKTGLLLKDHHVNDFAIDMLVNDEFKPVAITGVNVLSGKIAENKVQTNGEMNIQVAFNIMHQVSAVKIHVYGSDASAAVINEIYVLQIEEVNLHCFENDVDAILNLP